MDSDGSRKVSAVDFILSYFLVILSIKLVHFLFTALRSSG